MREAGLALVAMSAGMAGAGRPGDVRGFIHKKILGIVSKIPGPVGWGATGVKALLGGKKTVPGAYDTVDSAGGCVGGFTPVGGLCVPNALVNVLPQIPTRWPQIPVEDWASPSPGLGRPPGEAVMGRYGPAMQPAYRPTNTAVCLPGMVLGTDLLCYNRGEISNKERKWPRGRRPLLTGGDMRCISIANAAARKLQRTEKRLVSMGMLKKPARRAAQKQIGPGHHAHVAHD